ncbi:uncharacterized protein FIBRA_08266 [Fibroporia radiculosa]|uniref:Molybdate-anion transporter n=1 Tax=Fibroporia radiculosa TaxID=599839 RepID=J4I2G2_9APHY|nr:uncharacterized protein FIBRA_08266 [Fibroporia radiculosa]CCM06022.1 predicted protein [Fibroporia radiculosa]
MSAGLTAPLVGVWADHHGRRRLCLTFCITYTLTCICILFPYLPVLLVGRVLGGVSTSILYSAFESWLVSASNSLVLPQSDLSGIMGRASFVNGIVAAAAGVVSNQLVGTTASFASPFVASGILLLLAWVVIRGSWAENYGVGGGTSAANVDPLQLKRLGQAWRIIRSDPSLLVIGLTQTCFEGSMYLFVFNWVPALQEVAAADASLPLGYIFSSFMVSMMIGSLLYTSVVALFCPPDPNPRDPIISVSKSDGPLSLHAKLSSLVCAISSLAFAVLFNVQSDSPQLVYYPSDAWSPTACDQINGTQLRGSVTAGAWVKLTFTGTFVDAYGVVGTQGTNATFQLDDTIPFSLELPGQNTPDPLPLYSSSANLTASEHTLKITTGAGPPLCLNFFQYSGFNDTIEAPTPSAISSNKVSSPSVTAVHLPSGEHLKAGAICGIVVGCVAVALLVILAVLYTFRPSCFCRVRRKSPHQEDGVKVAIDDPPEPSRRYTLNVGVLRKFILQQSGMNVTHPASGSSGPTSSSAMFSSVIVMTPPVSSSNGSSSRNVSDRHDVRTNTYLAVSNG